MDTRLYPQGSRTLKSKYEDGVLVFRNPAGDEIYRIDPANRTITYAEDATIMVGSLDLADTLADFEARLTDLES